MAISGLIPRGAKLLEPFSRGLLVLEARERADCAVERFLSPGELVGGVPDSVLDRGASLHPGEQFLHLGHDLRLRSVGADRDPLRAVTDRRAPVEAITSLACPDDHPGAAGAAAEDAETCEQPLDFGRLPRGTETRCAR